MKRHEHHIRRIFARIETSEQVSQRSLARELGIALGLTNLLIRRLVTKGALKPVKIAPNKVRYLITRRGMLQYARLSRAYLRNSIKFYAETRDRIRFSFKQLSSQFPQNDHAPVSKRIIFYGTGDVAEIAYLCLQETDLTLVAVIDDCGRQRFFGVPLHPEPSCAPLEQAVASFDKLVVVSFAEGELIQQRLNRLSVPADRVFWV